MAIGTKRLQSVHRSIETLGRLTELYRKRRVQLAARVGLTEAQWRVLEEVKTEHFMPSLFARKSESTPAAVSKVIRQLTDKRLISVSISRHDGRQRRYALTAAGRRVMERIRELRESAINEVWMRIDSGEIERFDAFGERLIASIEAHAEREE
jgi:DNA-binding MarR family transcriptional regulator